MKNFRLLIGVILVIFIILVPLNIKIVANSLLPTTFGDQVDIKEDGDIVSYPVKIHKDIETFDKFLTIDTSKNDDYSIFESIDEIEFSGKFELNKTIYEITSFKFDENQDINDWIDKNYPAYIYNEDGFSSDFTTKGNRIVNKDITSLTSKIYGSYYLSFFKKFQNHLITLTFQLGKYEESDLSTILKSIKINDSEFQTNDTDIKNKLNNSKNDIITYNSIKNIQSFFRVSIGLNKVSADTVSYYLPWTKNESYIITQDWGANDNPPCTDCSHTGISGYAYDFGLPDGTIILASAGGTVTYNHTGENTCGGSDYLLKANYITISHADGKATEYHHLQTVDVNVNDQVIKGQVIGKSGKTGYTAVDGVNCGAHLHFQRQAQGGSYTQSEPIIFSEYPNQGGDGEIPYNTTVTSQNQLDNNDCQSTFYNIYDVIVNSGESYTCHAPDSITVIPNTEFREGSNVNLYID